MNSYPYFPKRRRIDLDGAWDFAWLGTGSDLESINPGILNYDELFAVPGIFDSPVKHPGGRGTGVCRRKVILDENSAGRMRLNIGGMGLYCKIWWDNRVIGESQLPYSSISFDFDAGEAGEHELAIAVDNRFDPVRSPLFSPYFDFYAYGGIYRSVNLETLPECRIDRVRVRTIDINDGSVELRILLNGELPGHLDFSLAFDNSSPRNFSLPVDKNAVTLRTNVPDFKLWSPEAPHLHCLTLKTGEDAIVERFGIRKVETCGQRILLNGKELRLMGVNRHESHPQWGPVQNTQLMLDDLALVKDLGCNFVRGAHYPMDQAFLDICDQLGLLVWQESMGWNNPEKDALNPEFVRLQTEQTRLMVHNSFNHPSVIIWGFMNECCSNTPGGRELYSRLAATIKDANPEFLVSYASNKSDKDICFDLADIITINTYPGWISDISWEFPPDSRIAGDIEKLAKIADSFDSNKPFIIGEIGACALYGCHDPANAQWSEEFQARYFEEACRRILEHPRYAGITLWQFFDTRSYVNAGEVRCKPRGFNCAGLLDEYRRPKLAYRSVRDLFRSFR